MIALPKLPLSSGNHQLVNHLPWAPLHLKLANRIVIVIVAFDQKIFTYATGHYYPKHLVSQILSNRNPPPTLPLLEAKMPSDPDPQPSNQHFNEKHPPTFPPPSSTPHLDTPTVQQRDS